MYKNLYINVITAISALAAAYLFSDMLLPVLRRLRLIKDGKTAENHGEKLTESGGTALCIGTVLASAAGLILLRFFSDDISFDSRTDPLFFAAEILIILGTAAGFYADILEGNGKKNGFSRPAFLLTEIFLSAVFLTFKYYTDNNTKLYIPLKGLKELGGKYYILCLAVMLITEESTNNLAKSIGYAPSVMSAFFLGAMTVFSHIKNSETALLCAALAGASMGMLMRNSPKAVLSEGNSGKLFFGISAAVITVISENTIFMAIMLLPAFIDALLILLKKTGIIKQKEKIITPSQRTEKILLYFLSGIVCVLLALLLFFKSKL